MADLVITAASVSADGAASIDVGTAGATITAGQPVYKDATDSNKLKLADADTLAASIAAGISLNPASSGQLCRYVKAGTLNLGSGVTAGRVYAVSSTAGGISTCDDVLVGDYMTVLGVGTSASAISVGIIPSRVTAAATAMWTATSRADGAAHATQTTKLYGQVTVPGSLIVPGAYITAKAWSNVAGSGGFFQQKLNIAGTAGATDGSTISEQRFDAPIADENAQADFDLVVRSDGIHLRSMGTARIGVIATGVPDHTTDIAGQGDSALGIAVGSDLLVKFIGQWLTLGGSATPNGMIVQVVGPDEAITLL